jgi:replicative DNA helicase
MIKIYDLAAEQALLGSMLSNPDVTTTSFLSVSKDAWFTPRHQHLAALLKNMSVRGEPIDLTTVKSLIAARGETGRLDDAFLESLYLGFHESNNAPTYAQRLLEVAGQRNLATTLQSTVDRFGDNWEEGYGLDVPTVVAQLRQACDEAIVSASPATYQLKSVVDLLADEDRYDWLVPGLMERMERLVLTGAEGGGKSVLITQMVCCLVGGLHPFTAAVLGDGDMGCRVAVVDCENNQRQARRRYRRLVGNVNDARDANGYGPPDWKSNLLLEFRPEGIDITRGADMSWLESFVSAAAPDVLVIGPLYRLSSRDESDSLAVREIQHALDAIRVRHNCAIITEAHAGHATDVSGERKVRPSGSSLWLRWPEFGYGMRRAKAEGEVAAFLQNASQRLQKVNRERPIAVDVVPWRGSREERSWPDRLRYGTTLPWEPFDPTYYDESEIIREF